MSQSGSAMLHSEAKPPRRPKFIGPIALSMAPAKIVKFPKLAPEVLEPFRR